MTHYSSPITVLLSNATFMKLLNSIPELATLQGPLVLVPGTMDGVHRGHQALIYRGRQEAKKLGGTAVVMTFDQHPSTLLRPDKAPRLLTSTAQKLSLLEQLGVERVLLLSFDQKLAATSAEEFIQQLVEQNLKTICVGGEWIFGRGGKGNIALLHRLGEQLKFSVIRIEPVEISNMRISSTNLRQAIASGHLIDAAAGLGRRYAIAGLVIEGAGRGKKIGYPTANLFIQKAQFPPFGVYTVRARAHGKTFSGVANIGVRPTVQKISSISTSHLNCCEATVEIHLFDFAGNLYGEEMELELLSFLRPEKIFSSFDELKAQIAIDVEIAKKVENSTSNNGQYSSTC
ncbi:MAG: riboflavin biosynthesis protein RibF [Chthoniobacterales bacterium]